jgi:hypothetical protein
VDWSGAGRSGRDGVLSCLEKMSSDDADVNNH